VIATSWPTSPANVVYFENMNGKTATLPFGFTPEPGKTYYWAVRGTDPSGQIVWSDPRSFSMKQEETPGSSNPQPVVILYPNPGDGQHINLSLQANYSCEFLVTLYSIDGNALGSKRVDYPGSEAMVVSFSGLNLAPGIYLMKVRSESSNVIKKLIVMR